ncbi:MAG TPA: hypothetical protein VF320_10790 [Acidimicrobiales bacterium]
MAWVLQKAAIAGYDIAARRRGVVFPELPGNVTELTIPTSVAPAPAFVYAPLIKAHTLRSM